MGAYRCRPRALTTQATSCRAAGHQISPITPAAEWLLDNFHLVEQQLQQIADDLPPGYYRQLPKLAEGRSRAIRAFWASPGPMSRIPTAC
jgi:hypothetical protein